VLDIIGESHIIFFIVDKRAQVTTKSKREDFREALLFKENIFPPILKFPFSPGATGIFDTLFNALLKLLLERF
jgi:hypothetical protein